jgi:hypothetical protein
MSSDQLREVPSQHGIKREAVRSLPVEEVHRHVALVVPQGKNVLFADQLAGWGQWTAAMESSRTVGVSHRGLQPPAWNPRRQIV